MTETENTDVIPCPVCKTTGINCSSCNSFGYVYRTTRISYRPVKVTNNRERILD